MKKRNLYIFILSFILFISILFLLIIDKVESIDNSSRYILNIFNNNYHSFLLGITNIIGIAGILILSLLLIVLLKRKNKLKVLKTYIYTLTIGTTSISILKLIIHRARPTLKLLEISGYSFPSGHSYTATVVYGFFILIIHRYYNTNRYRYILYIMFFSMIILTCISRIYFNVHYVSDVLAGFFLGLVTLTISNHFLKRFS